MIYTFYSYKGGVGRSMSLANVAELFYWLGLRVLMVDWDLEAPGLERFFPVGEQHGIGSRPGLLDLLLSYKKQMTQGLPATTSATSTLPFELPDPCLVDVYPPGESAGRLRLLTAGDRSDFETYAYEVRSFDWRDFYENWEGETYFEWLRQQFERLADVILIDSRTGVAEMSGAATYQLGDVVVMFCAPNQQNLEGTAKMAGNFTRPQVQETRSDRPVRLLVVPARVEDRAEEQSLIAFRKQFIDRFSSFMPEPFNTDPEALWRLKIPYKPFYAFNELVAVREQAKQGTAQFDDMVGAFSALVQAMCALAPFEPDNPNSVSRAVERLTQVLRLGRPLTKAEFHTDSLNGSQRLQLYEALLAAFPTERLLFQMVRHGLNQPLGSIAGTGNLSDVAFNLVQWAEAEGLTTDLVKAALAENPVNSKLQTVAKSMGIVVEEASWGSPA
jgi:cellulose biosynthesis protein BcsQ